MFTLKSGVVLFGQKGAFEGGYGSAVYARDAYDDFVKDAVALGLTVKDMGDGYWQAIEPSSGLPSGEFETLNGGMIAFDA